MHCGAEPAPKRAAAGSAGRVVNLPVVGSMKNALTELAWAGWREIRSHVCEIEELALMVDNHGSRIGHGAGVVHCTANQRLERTVGADRIGQNQARGVHTLPRIDQVYVLGAGIDETQIVSPGGNGCILRQRQLATAVRIDEDSLRRIGGAPAAFLDGVDIRVTRNHNKVDRSAAYREVSKVDASRRILKLLVGDQREPAGIGVDVEGRDVSTDRGGISSHIAHTSRGIGDLGIKHKQMGAGRVGLDRDRIVALAGISCLEAQSTLSADGEERDVWLRCYPQAYPGGTSRLSGSPAACV